MTDTPVVLFLCTHNGGCRLAARVPRQSRANRADGWLEGANIS
jgi:hypothetical protein